MIPEYFRIGYNFHYQSDRNDVTSWNICILNSIEFIL